MSSAGLLEESNQLLWRRLPRAHSGLLSAVLCMGNSFLGAHAWISLEEALGLNRLRAVRHRDA
jgi:hypothetical protein